jgi:hypothetical protein
MIANFGDTSYVPMGGKNFLWSFSFSDGIAIPYIL